MLSRQCREHDRVGVPMLGTHGKQMLMTERFATHDKARACTRHGVALATEGLGRKRQGHTCDRGILS